MAEDPTSGQDPDPSAGDPSAGSGTDPSGAGDAFDAERAKALIDKLRPFEKQSKSLQKQVDDLSAKLRERDEADLSDLQKAQARLAELEGQQTDWQRERQELLTRGVLGEAAQRAGAIHPDAVWKLVDLADLDFDDGGTPTPKSVESAVGSVRTAYPTLFRDRPAGNGDGGARGSGSAGPGDMNSIIRQAAGRG